MIDQDEILPFVCLGLFSVFSFIFYLKARSNRLKILSSILLASNLAIMAYFFVPRQSYDLVRHYEMAERFTEVDSLSGFIEKSTTYDLEFIPQLYGFFIAKIGDYALMQTFLVLFGYSFLLYILKDYKDRSNLPTEKFIPITLMVIFGQHILFYFSGLFNYFAINLFSFGIYLDYIKKKRICPWIIYLLSPFIHSSMFLPLAILLFYKIRRKPINKKSMFIFTLVMLFVNTIITIVVDTLNIELLNHIKATYDAYYLHPSDYLVSLYDGFYLFMSVSKMMIVIFALILQRRKIKSMPLYGLTYYLSSATIIMSIMSIAMTRFSSLAFFVSVPFIIDSMNEKGIAPRLMTVIIALLSVVYAIYSIMTIVPFINFI